MRTYTCVHCAVTASSDAVSDPAGARKLGRASIGVSISGAVLGIIALIITAVIINRDITRACPHAYNGKCYNHRTTEYGYEYCSGEKDGVYCYYN